MALHFPSVHSLPTQTELAFGFQFLSLKHKRQIMGVGYLREVSCVKNSDKSKQKSGKERNW
jgi:hypothetical protein